MVNEYNARETSNIVTEADFIRDDYGNVYINPKKIQTRTFTRDSKKLDSDRSLAVFCGSEA